MIQSPLSQQDLLFFVTLCRLQSLTVCAQKLELSLSSASRILTHLREVFGEQLFVRNKGGLIPTSTAQALLPRALRLLDCYDELFEPEVFDPATAQRVIRIATADMGAVSILTKVIPVILEKAPDLDFHILPIESNLVSKLTSGEIDFGIYPSEKHVPGVHCVKLYESPYRYVVRTGHPLEAIYHVQKKLTEKDLARWSHINALIPPGAGIDVSTYTEIMNRNLPGRTQIHSAYILPQPALIAATDLVGIMPEILIRGAQEAGIRITGLSPVFTSLRHKPHLFWHERNNGDTLLAWIRAIFVHVSHEEKSAPTFPFPLA